jgi:hypothetical protein
MWRGIDEGLYIGLAAIAGVWSLYMDNAGGRMTGKPGVRNNKKK